MNAPDKYGSIKISMVFEPRIIEIADYRKIPNEDMWYWIIDENLPNFMRHNEELDDWSEEAIDNLVELSYSMFLKNKQRLKGKSKHTATELQLQNRDWEHEIQLDAMLDEFKEPVEDQLFAAEITADCAA